MRDMCCLARSTLLVPGVTLQLLVFIQRCSILTASSAYVTYLPGELPIILSAPHGGREEPDSMVAREPGCVNGTHCTYTHQCTQKDQQNCRVTTVTDTNTRELTMEVREELYHLTGRHPHVVINELRRTILDANRDIYQGAYGVAEVEAVWNEYHKAINQSKASFPGAGLFIDMHGQGHEHGCIELGYLISGTNLDQGRLDPETSSIRSLACSLSKTVAFPDLLRGEDSFGGLLEKHGYPTIPSPQHPTRDGGRYYSGGYNTKVHGSRAGGVIDAIQIESHYSQRLDTAIRQTYAGALAQTILSFMRIHYNMDLTLSGNATDRYVYDTVPCASTLTHATLSLVLANCALVLYHAYIDK